MRKYQVQFEHLFKFEGGVIYVGFKTRNSEKQTGITQNTLNTENFTSDTV